MRKILFINNNKQGSVGRESKFKEYFRVFIINERLFMRIVLKLFVWFFDADDLGRFGSVFKTF